VSPPAGSAGILPASTLGATHQQARCLRSQLAGSLIKLTTEVRYQSLLAELNLPRALLFVG